MLADAVPLYALLFSAHGLSDAQISALLAVWSLTGVVAEVPTGALADRFSRTGSMAAGGVAQALAYVLWTAFPGFGAFAAGFVLWGIGGTLVSGAVEAWLYDSLVELGEPERFRSSYGRLDACELLAQVPAAVGATVLFPLGGFELVGWAGVATCLGAAAVAARLPEPPRHDPATNTDGADTDDADTDGGQQGGGQQGSGDQGSGPQGELGYVATLRAGIVAAVRTPGVPVALFVVALLTSLDNIEEYFGLLAEDWHVPVRWVPLAVLGIPLAGAAGALFAARLRDRWASALLSAGVALFAVAGLWAQPTGLALVAVFYALYRGVLVVAEARLQERIAGATRATVTSIAGVGIELAGLLVFAAWAVAGLPATLVLAAVVAFAVTPGLRSRNPGGARAVRGHTTGEGTRGSAPHP
ncbi:MFS family permease [Prauserella isguenensis]|uniref:MFS family permease n=1 Tax=Prauserella isguenensis TaxID=1470180 RepID=A0A839S8D8_9PSEU|nr:MFS family permease [Prauserella isguenensis]